MSAEIIPLAPITVPAAGGAYIDPMSGLTITRVTAAEKWAAPDYSTWCPWNADQSRFLLVNVDHFELHGASTPQALPIGASCDPRWSLTDPGLLYFVQGNALNSLEIGTGRVVTVRSFPEYETVRIGSGEGDLSYDGCIFGLVGTDGSADAFTYNLKSNSKSLSMGTAGRSLDAVYMAPSGVLLKWVTGIELREFSMSPLRPIMGCDGHGAVGPDNFLHITNSNENPVTLPDFPNGIVRIDLSTGKQTGLLSLPWSLAVDVAACAPGVILVSTYSAPGIPWTPYMNELLLIPTDGSPLTRLAHTRTSGNSSWSSDDNYLVQPHAQISRDGKKIMFGSNMANPTEPGRCDTYAIDLAATVSHQRPPRPGQGPKGGPR